MNNKLLDFLVKTGLISPQQVLAVTNRQQQTNVWLVDVLLEVCRISDIDLARALGQFYQYNVIDIARVHPRTTALELLPRDIARRFCALPFSFDRSGETLLVAVADPEFAAPALELIQQAWPRQKQIFIAPRQALLSTIDPPASLSSTPHASTPLPSPRASRPQVQVSMSGSARNTSRPNFDDSNPPGPWPASDASITEIRNELRNENQQLASRLDLIEQALQTQIPARFQQLDQAFQTRLNQSALDIAHDVSQGLQHHLQQQAQKTEQNLQVQVDKLQEENQALRLQVQRLERTLHSEVDLLRQLLSMLLEQPQTDRKLYAERTAPLR